MAIKTVTYTSLASVDLNSLDIEAIHRTAREANSFDAITGLLIFNGTHFLQIIEGDPEAIDALMDRIRRDPRHNHVEIRDERTIDRRSFPDWSMELVRVSASYFEAKDTIAERLPEATADDVRSRVVMTEAISGTVAL